MEEELAQKRAIRTEERQERGTGVGHFSVWILILVIVILVAIWWFWGIAKLQPTTPTPDDPGVDFTPLYDDFASYPEETWFETPENIQATLCGTPYHYRVYLSSGELYFDGRGGEGRGDEKFPPSSFSSSFPSPSLSSFSSPPSPPAGYVEYIQAAALGDGALVRDGMRNVAIKVTGAGLWGVRIVHISAPCTF